MSFEVLSHTEIQFIEEAINQYKGEIEKATNSILFDYGRFVASTDKLHKFIIDLNTSKKEFCVFVDDLIRKIKHNNSQHIVMKQAKNKSQMKSLLSWVKQWKRNRHA